MLVSNNSIQGVWLIQYPHLNSCFITFLFFIWTA